jgi:hypothetical protein
VSSAPERPRAPARPDRPWPTRPRRAGSRLVRLPRLAARAGVAAACLALTVAAAAQTCPQASELPPSATAERLRGLSERVDRAPRECEDDPGFLALRGALALKAGRPADAAVLLEKSLMLDPAQPGTILDYALAREALSDYESARSLYMELLEHHAPPEALRTMIERRIAGLGRLPAAPARRWGGSISLMAGYDTNLNSAPTIASLSLTTPQGVFDLQLDPASRAQAGPVVTADARFAGAVPLADGRGVRVLARLVDREAPGNEAFRSQVIDGDATFLQPFATGRLLATGGASALVFGGETLVRSVRLGAGYEAAALAGYGTEGLQRSCVSQFGVDYDQRTYPVRPDLDGRLLHLSGRLLCDRNGHTTLVSLRLTSDQPVAARAGGAQQRVELQALWGAPFAGGRLRGLATLAVASDEDGYNPLIENGISRKTQWAGLGLEYSRPIGGAFEALVTLDAFRQFSNIPLFRTHGETLQFGLRRVF